MKHVKLERTLSTIEGKPMQIPDINADPKPGEAPPMTAADPINCLKLIVYNLPRQSLTMKDSIEAGRFIEQCRGANNGTVGFEDGTYDWLVKQVDDHAPQMFGINATVIRGVLDNLVDREGNPKLRSKK